MWPNEADELIRVCNVFALLLTINKKFLTLKMWKIMKQALYTSNYQLSLEKLECVPQQHSSDKRLKLRHFMGNLNSPPPVLFLIKLHFYLEEFLKSFLLSKFIKM